jgi:hypothetical protein
MKEEFARHNMPSCDFEIPSATWCRKFAVAEVLPLVKIPPAALAMIAANGFSAVASADG